MKMLLYIYIFKLVVLFLIFAFIMYEPKDIKNNNEGFSDSEFFLFKTFAIDYAVTGN
ncbi:hypothetical protein ACOTVP_08815 [Aliarcobacter butzleri]